MAVTGFDFLMPTIKQHNYELAFSIIMDKQSFDLNKHALDLNEAPSNELGLDSREPSCSHELGSSLHPRRGGWLELFRNMFGHDKADGIPQHSDSRTFNSQCSQMGQRIHNGHAGGQNGDVADGVTEVSNLVPMPDKHRKNCKPFDSEEFNHLNTVASAPIFNNSAMAGSHVKKPIINASGQPRCATDLLPPFFSSPEVLKLKRVSGPWGCDGKGAQHLNELYSNVDQARVGSSISHGFDQYKASVPLLDLSSQPFPQWTADFLPLRHAEASCLTSSGLFSQMQVMDKVAQVSEVASMEANKDLGSLTICVERGKGSTCSLKKGTGRFGREKALGMMNSQSASEDRERGQDPRVRIITSPDWLPAGWITEVKTRMAGSTAGTTDKYYKDPVTGRRFRSKNEVLSFLQTGRLCRNKHQLKPVEAFAAMSTVPLLLPTQNQSLGPLDNSQAVLDRTTFLTSAKDFSCQASVCQSSCTPNVILERQKLNEEQMNMTQYSVLSASSDVCRVSDFSARVEGSGSCTMQEIVNSEANDVCKPYVSIRPGISNVCVYNEPVCKHKRKAADDSVCLLSPKRLRSTAKHFQSKDKWISCMEQISRDAERQQISTGVESDLRIARDCYPGLLNRLDPKAAQDKAVADYLTARYKANLKALGLYDTSLIKNTSEVNLGCMKELQPRAAFLFKGGEKKSVKLILKQERDLLVTLGRKLCVEFLASAKESSLQG